VRSPWLKSRCRHAQPSTLPQSTVAQQQEVEAQLMSKLRGAYVGKHAPRKSWGDTTV